MPKKPFAAGLAILYFLTNVAFLHAAESNFWRDRHSPGAPQAKKITLASLPAQFPPPLISLKSIASYRNPAAPASVASNDPGRDPLSRISFSSGRVVQANRASESMPDVLLIQDIHLNAEAQRNIAMILRDLTTGLKEPLRPVIAVEGAFDRFDFSSFHVFTDTGIVQTAADALIRQEKISAPSFIGLTMGEMAPVIQGVDDPEAYRGNLDALRRSMKEKSNATATLSITDTTLEAARRRMRPLLREWDTKKTAYHRSRLDFAGYLQFVVGLLPPDGGDLPLEVQADIERFLETHALERTLDFSIADEEKNQVVRLLAERLTPSDKQSLIDQSIAYRMGKLRHADFFQGLETLLRRHAVRLDRFPHFASYLRYVLMADGLNPGDLHRGLRAAEEAAWKTLSPTINEQAIWRRSRRLSLTEKLVDFSLTSDEWEEYRRLRLDETQNVGVEFTELNKAVTPFEDFYRHADRRSDRIVENLIKAKKTFSEAPAILVVGGFHSDRIVRRLEDQKISFAVVQPAISKVETLDGTEYLSVFSREKAPLARIFDGDKLFLAPTSVHLRTNVGDDADLRALRVETLALIGANHPPIAASPNFQWENRGRFRINDGARTFFAATAKPRLGRIIARISDPLNRLKSVYVWRPAFAELRERLPSGSGRAWRSPIRGNGSLRSILHPLFSVFRGDPGEKTRQSTPAMAVLETIVFWTIPLMSATTFPEAVKAAGAAGLAFVLLHPLLNFLRTKRWEPWGTTRDRFRKTAMLYGIFLFLAYLAPLFPSREANLALATVVVSMLHAHYNDMAMIFGWPLLSLGRSNESEDEAWAWTVFNALLYPKDFKQAVDTATAKDWPNFVRLYRQSMISPKVFSKFAETLANAVAKENDFQKAREILNEALDILPNDIFLLHAYGRIASRSGQPLSAIERFRAKWNSRKKDVRFVTLFGKLCRQAGHAQEGIERLMSVYPVFRQNIVFITTLASLYGQVDPAAGIALLERHWPENPNDFYFLTTYANLSLLAGRSREAIARINGLFHEIPQDEILRTALSSLYNQEADRAQLAGNHRQALSFLDFAERLLNGKVEKIRVLILHLMANIQGHYSNPRAAQGKVLYVSKSRPDGRTFVFHESLLEYLVRRFSDYRGPASQYALSRETIVAIVTEAMDHGVCYSDVNPLWPRTGLVHYLSEPLQRETGIYRLVLLVDGDDSVSNINPIVGPEIHRHRMHGDVPAAFTELTFHQNLFWNIDPNGTMRPVRLLWGAENWGMRHVLLRRLQGVGEAEAERFMWHAVHRARFHGETKHNLVFRLDPKEMPSFQSDTHRAWADYFGGRPVFIKIDNKSFVFRDIIRQDPLESRPQSWNVAPETTPDLNAQGSASAQKNPPASLFPAWHPWHENSPIFESALQMGFLFFGAVLGPLTFSSSAEYAWQAASVLIGGSIGAAVGVAALAALHTISPARYSKTHALRLLRPLSRFAFLEWIMVMPAMLLGLASHDSKAAFLILSIFGSVLATAWAAKIHRAFNRSISPPPSATTTPLTDPGWEPLPTDTARSLTVGLLTRLREEPVFSVRRAIRRALDLPLEDGNTALELIDALSDEDMRTVRSAAYALVGATEAHVITALTSIVGDKKLPLLTREGAAWALSGTTDRLALDALIRALKHDPENSFGVIRALHGTRDRAARRALWQKARHRKTDPTDRMLAMEALQAESPKPLDVGMQLPDEVETELHRIHALSGKFDDAGIAHLTRSLYADHWRIRLAAVEVLSPALRDTRVARLQRPKWMLAATLQEKLEQQLGHPEGAPHFWDYWKPELFRLALFPSESISVVREIQRLGIHRRWHRMSELLWLSRWVAPRDNAAFLAYFHPTENAHPSPVDLGWHGRSHWLLVDHNRIHVTKVAYVSPDSLIYLRQEAEIRRNHGQDATEIVLPDDLILPPDMRLSRRAIAYTASLEELHYIEDRKVWLSHNQQVDAFRTMAMDYLVELNDLHAGGELHGSLLSILHAGRNPWEWNHPWGPGDILRLDHGLRYSNFRWHGLSDWEHRRASSHHLDRTPEYFSWILGVTAAGIKAKFSDSEISRILGEGLRVSLDRLDSISTFVRKFRRSYQTWDAATMETFQPMLLLSKEAAARAEHKPPINTDTTTRAPPQTMVPEIGHFLYRLADRWAPPWRWAVPFVSAILETGIYHVVFSTVYWGALSMGPETIPLVATAAALIHVPFFFMLFHLHVFRGADRQATMAHRGDLGTVFIMGTVYALPYLATMLTPGGSWAAAFALSALIHILYNAMAYRAGWALTMIPMGGGRSKTGPISQGQFHRIVSYEFPIVVLDYWVFLLLSDFSSQSGLFRYGDDRMSRLLKFLPLTQYAREEIGALMKLEAVVLPNTWQEWNWENKYRTLFHELYHGFLSAFPGLVGDVRKRMKYLLRKKSYVRHQGGRIRQWGYRRAAVPEETLVYMAEDAEMEGRQDSLYAKLFSDIPAMREAVHNVHYLAKPPAWLLEQIDRASTELGASSIPMESPYRVFGRKKSLRILRDHHLRKMMAFLNFFVEGSPAIIPFQKAMRLVAGGGARVLATGGASPLLVLTSMAPTVGWIIGQPLQIRQETDRYHLEPTLREETAARHSDGTAAPVIHPNGPIPNAMFPRLGQFLYRWTERRAPSLTPAVPAIAGALETAGFAVVYGMLGRLEQTVSPLFYFSLVLITVYFVGCFFALFHNRVFDGTSQQTREKVDADDLLLFLLAGFFSSPFVVALLTPSFSLAWALVLSASLHAGYNEIARRANWLLAMAADGAKEEDAPGQTPLELFFLRRFLRTVPGVPAVSVMTNWVFMLLSEQTRVSGGLNFRPGSKDPKDKKRAAARQRLQNAPLYGPIRDGIARLLNNEGIFLPASWGQGTEDQKGRTLFHERFHSELYALAPRITVLAAVERMKETVPIFQQFQTFLIDHGYEPPYEEELLTYTAEELEYGPNPSDVEWFYRVLFPMNPGLAARMIRLHDRIRPSEMDLTLLTNETLRIHDGWMPVLPHAVLNKPASLRVLSESEAPLTNFLVADQPPVLGPETARRLVEEEKARVMLSRTNGETINLTSLPATNGWKPGFPVEWTPFLRPSEFQGAAKEAARDLDRGVSSQNAQAKSDPNTKHVRLSRVDQTPGAFSLFSIAATIRFESFPLPVTFLPLWAFRLFSPSFTDDRAIFNHGKIARQIIHLNFLPLVPAAIKELASVAQLKGILLPTSWRDQPDRLRFGAIRHELAHHIFGRMRSKEMILAAVQQQRAYSPELDRLYAEMNRKRYNSELIDEEVLIHALERLSPKAPPNVKRALFHRWTDGNAALTDRLLWLHEQLEMKSEEYAALVEFAERPLLSQIPLVAHRVFPSSQSREAMADWQRRTGGDLMVNFLTPYLQPMIFPAMVEALFQTNYARFLLPEDPKLSPAITTLAPSRGMRPGFPKSTVTLKISASDPRFILTDPGQSVRPAAMRDRRRQMKSEDADAEPINPHRRIGDLMRRIFQTVHPDDFPLPITILTPWASRLFDAQALEYRAALQTGEDPQLPYKLRASPLIGKIREEFVKLAAVRSILLPLTWRVQHPAVQKDVLRHERAHDEFDFSQERLRLFQHAAAAAASDEEVAILYEELRQKGYRPDVIDEEVLVHAIERTPGSSSLANRKARFLRFTAGDAELADALVDIHDRLVISEATLNAVRDAAGKTDLVGIPLMAHRIFSGPAGIEQLKKWVERTKTDLIVNFLTPRVAQVIAMKSALAILETGYANILFPVSGKGFPAVTPLAATNKPIAAYPKSLTPFRFVQESWHTSSIGIKRLRDHVRMKETRRAPPLGLMAVLHDCVLQWVAKQPWAKDNVELQRVAIANAGALIESILLGLVFSWQIVISQGGFYLPEQLLLATAQFVVAWFFMRAHPVVYRGASEVPDTVRTRDRFLLFGLGLLFSAPYMVNSVWPTAFWLMFVISAAMHIGYNNLALLSAQPLAVMGVRGHRPQRPPVRTNGAPNSDGVLELLVPATVSTGVGEFSFSPRIEELDRRLREAAPEEIPEIIDQYLPGRAVFTGIHPPNDADSRSLLTVRYLPSHWDESRLRREMEQTMNQAGNPLRTCVFVTGNRVSPATVERINHELRQRIGDSRLRIVANGPELILDRLIVDAGISKTKTPSMVDVFLSRQAQLSSGMLSSLKSFEARGGRLRIRLVLLEEAISAVVVGLTLNDLLHPEKHRRIRSQA